MRKPIQDEFTHLPVSRQRKYQLRMQRDGRCRECGAPAATGLSSLCLRHLVKTREHARERLGVERRYRNALSYKVQAGTENTDLPGEQVSRSAPLQFAFHADEPGVAVSSVSNGTVTKLGLTVSLQTFLTALTWICSSNKVPLAGWLTVTLGSRSGLFRVMGALCDSSFPKIIPASRKMPPVLRGAIRALGEGKARSGNGYLRTRPGRSLHHRCLLRAGGRPDWQLSPNGE